MSTILETERQTYHDLWGAVEHYADHSPGEQYAPLFLEMVGRPTVRQAEAMTVLDAGCGSGKGALALRAAGFQVLMCDVTDAGLRAEAKAMPFEQSCLWHDLSIVVRDFGQFGRTKADWVYCTDVLEHIPPAFTMLTVDQLLRVARRGVFLAVSLVPDSFGVWVGKSLHQTVQPFQWWRDHLAELGTVREARDLLSSAVFLVTR